MKILLIIVGFFVYILVGLDYISIFIIHIINSNRSNK